MRRLQNTHKPRAAAFLDTRLGTCGSCSKVCSVKTRQASKRRRVICGKAHLIELSGFLCDLVYTLGINGLGKVLDKSMLAKSVELHIWDDRHASCMVILRKKFFCHALIRAVFKRQGMPRQEILVAHARQRVEPVGPT